MTTDLNYEKKLCSEATWVDVLEAEEPEISSGDLIWMKADNSMENKSVIG